jgi:mannosidase alpha-like ER degradation enhancer 2
MHTYNAVLRQYGMPPEFYNIGNQEAVHKRAGYPLRPELAESLMYLYRATEDPTWLSMAADMVDVRQYVHCACGAFIWCRQLNTVRAQNVAMPPWRMYAIM